jgi:phenylalanyl-tRNA synthetase alpha chain
MTIDRIQQQFEIQIADVTDLAELDALRVKFVGKNGILTEQAKQIAHLSLEERKSFGAATNALKQQISQQLETKKLVLEQVALQAKLADEVLDITLPTREVVQGYLHPLSMVMHEIREILHFMGFTQQHGNEIETDWYNFTALNIAENHPARQMHDTFYVKDKSAPETQNLLLRTHTSNVQIRTMQGSQPPFRFFTMGKTYRSDSDSTHSPMFHQLEVVYVAEKASVANLKHFLEEFLSKFFELELLPIRMRSSHFPFTEPSIEVDVQCDRSDKQQVVIGKGNDWIEILGCGMIHPQVLRNCDIDPELHQGFAMGVGIERLAMLKYNIPDLRQFFEGDVRWLKHYGF